MILMSKMLDLFTMKAQKYIKFNEIDDSGVKITFFAILSQIWNLDSLYCTNLEYKSVMIVLKTIWMIFLSIRLDFDIRKVQEYVKYKEIGLWGEENHVLCYFIRNLGIKWPILH